MSKLSKNLTLSDFGQAVRTGSDNMILISSTKNITLFEKLKVNFLLIANVQITKK